MPNHSKPAYGNLTSFQEKHFLNVELFNDTLLFLCVFNGLN
jgi:hypothetical protein